MEKVLLGLPEGARSRVVRRPQPSWVAPMLATLTERRFSDPAWLFERKLDGERCLAFREGREVRLMSRNQKRIDNHYPEIVEALAAQDPKGTRRGLGALLVGYYEGDRLVYAGKVGTGFDEEMLDWLSKKLAGLRRQDPPFDDGQLPRKEVHWVHPGLVCQIGFSEWTRDGRLRHPRFMGLREDKPAGQVVRERPVRPSP